ANERHAAIHQVGHRDLADGAGRHASVVTDDLDMQTATVDVQTPVLRTLMGYAAILTRAIEVEYFAAEDASQGSAVRIGEALCGREYPADADRLQSFVLDEARELSHRRRVAIQHFRLETHETGVILAHDALVENRAAQDFVRGRKIPKAALHG